MRRLGIRIELDLVLVRRVGRRHVGAFWLSRRTQQPKRRPAYVETGTNSTGDETFGRQIPINTKPTDVGGAGLNRRPTKIGVVGALHTRRGIGHCCGRGGSSTGSSFTVPLLISHQKPIRLVSCWHDVLPCRGRGRIQAIQQINDGEN